MGQGLHESGEWHGVGVEGGDGVGVGAVEAGAGEVEAGDSVAGFLQEGGELVPAPGAVAGAMNHHKVMMSLSFHESSADPI